MEIIGTSPLHVYHQVLREFHRGAGEYSQPRGRGAWEVRDVTLMIDQPWLIPFDLQGRGLSSFIGAVEALQLVGQTSMPELVRLAPAMGQYTDYGLFHGAYGTRVAGHLGEIVRTLAEDRHSRQAVLTIFNADKDLGRKRRDIPCTLTIQYFVRRNKLHQRVSMRSNDVWLGLPYDLIQFAALQGAIAAALGVEMGSATHTVGSMHLYDHDAPKLQHLPTNIVNRLMEQDAGYRPLWNGTSITEIGIRARDILNGQPPATVSAFELWALESIATKKASA